MDSSCTPFQHETGQSQPLSPEKRFKLEEVIAEDTPSRPRRDNSSLRCLCALSPWNGDTRDPKQPEREREREGEGEREREEEGERERKRETPVFYTNFVAT